MREQRKGRIDDKGENVQTGYKSERNKRNIEKGKRISLKQNGGETY